MTDWKTNFAAAVRGRTLVAEPMSRRCSYKVGGPAEIMFFPADADDLADGLAWLKKNGKPFRALGSGCNVLPPDDGLPGATINLSAGFRTLEIEGTRARAGAGFNLSALALKLARRGLAGLESLSGVPGTVGGAVWMNAGAFGQEIGERVASVLVVAPDGERVRKEKKDLKFEYRKSGFQGSGEIILSVDLDLERAAPEAILARIEEIKAKRISTQPHDAPSAGSVFKNPPGSHAGALIERAGLKGLRRGGAAVSEKHANFLVNEGGATAADFLGLIDEVRACVKEKLGVDLELEILILQGGPDPAETPAPG